MIKEKLTKFKNFKKAVIVGGGPSAAMQEWEKVSEASEGVIFLACNRISLLFDSVSWRPDIYTCFTANSLVKKAWIDSIDTCLSDERILSFVFKDFKSVSSIKNHHDNAVFCKSVKEHYRHSKISHDFLDVDLDEAILKSYSATVPLFQICDQLNVDKILIVGQDGYVFNRGENHFHSTYQDEPADFKRINDRILRLHTEFKRYFDKKEVNLYSGSKSSIINNIHDFLTIEDFIS